MAHSTARQSIVTGVIPKHYDLTLEPDLERSTFHGTVRILLDVEENTSSISLNVHELDILSTEIIPLPEPSTPISNPRVYHDADKQVVVIMLETPLMAGTQVHLVHIFRGRLSDQMAGFYLSSYQDSDGQTKVLASSHMEATEARRAFPCFDEPALKATFSITLIVDKHLACLSNMDIAEETEFEVASKGDSERMNKVKKAVRFNQTPKMSTYLLAFVVGELQSVKSNAFRVPVQVIVPRRKDINIEHGHFALDLAIKTLQFYEKTFGIAYPLPKLDMVAIPDFPAGAMENWGLITFREADLLFDDSIGSISNKLRTAVTVQHEIAHQWFGNLVTMDFWDGLWLKEGFATWMAWYACDHFFPDWKVWERFVGESFQLALSLDSLRSSHPVEVPLQNATEIGQIFDAISYLKGCSLVRMAYSYLGEDHFMDGIRNYLETHAYASATTMDLWAALGKASGKDVMAMMAVWTKQVGHPVVMVTVSEDSICVRQERFLPTANMSLEEAAMVYPVPLNIRTVDGVLNGITFTDKEVTMKVDGFLKLNAHHTGIYRTCYSPEYLQKLAQTAVKDGILGVADRVGLIADTGVLASFGYLKTSAFLQLLRNFTYEPQYIVWEVIVAHFNAIQSAWIFEDPRVQEGLKAFLSHLVRIKAFELGWNLTGIDHTEKQLKSLLFGTAAGAGERAIIDASREMFSDFSSKQVAIDPNLRPHVFRIVLENGGPHEYDVILSEYLTAKTSMERNTALRSLGYARDATLVHRTLELALTDCVRDQDVHLAINSLQSHPTGIEALWMWLQWKWSALSARFTGRAMGAIVKTCTAGLSTKHQLESAKLFFDGQDTQGIKMHLAQALETISVKCAWVERDRQDVTSFIEDWCH